MPAMIITGVFPDADSALRAGERAREVAGPRAAIRVLVPGPNGKVIETSVLCDKSSYWQMPVFGLALGVLLAAGLVFYGVSLGYVLLSLLASLATGAMFGIWLSGEAFPRRLFSASESASREALQKLLSGQSVVSVVLRDRSHAAVVAGILREAGGGVAQGFMDAGRGGLPPLATT